MAISDARSGTRYDSIQILRAVAALAVVVFHAGQRVAVPFGVGQAGVDIFFVISGFVMWIVSDNGKTPIEFIRARILRIVPLYWVATLLMAVGAWLGLFPRMRVAWDDLLASLFFVPYYSLSSTKEIVPVLRQGWTLNYEMFFYVSFALALMLKRSIQIPVLVLWFIALSICGLISSSHGIVLSFCQIPSF